MTDSTCKAGKIVVLPCSGSANCGQIANAVGLELTRQGLGSMFCLAGVAAHIDNMVEQARAAQRLFVIDGCATACARKAVEHAGLTVTDYLVVTEQGIVKNHDLDLDRAQVASVATAARRQLLQPRKAG